MMIKFMLIHLILMIILNHQKLNLKRETSYTNRIINKQSWPIQAARVTGDPPPQNRRHG